MKMPRHQLIAASCLAAVLCLSTNGSSADKEGTKWNQIKSTRGSRGGKTQFQIGQDTKVKFEWDVRPKRVGNTTFRLNVSKRNDRTGNYQIIGTLFKTTAASKKHLYAKLKKGHYQIYLSVKNMDYDVTISTESK